MSARMANPAMVIPEAMSAIQALGEAVKLGGVPERTLGLVHLRVSQINGCVACQEWGACGLRDDGESDARLLAVAGWRNSALFDDAERAALALGESVTRLADCEDAVPDDVWNEAARCYDERGLAALLLAIATTNVYNRLNVSVRFEADSWN